MASAIEPIPPEKPAQSLQSIGVEAKAKALSLYGLPNELMLEICVHLTIDEAFCFTAVCTLFNRFIPKSWIQCLYLADL